VRGEGVHCALCAVTTMTGVSASTLTSVRRASRASKQLGWEILEFLPQMCASCGFRAGTHTEQCACLPCKEVKGTTVLPGASVYLGAVKACCYSVCCSSGLSRVNTEFRFMFSTTTLLLPISVNHSIRILQDYIGGI
jgi:hypothetical protein